MQKQLIKDFDEIEINKNKDNSYKSDEKEEFTNIPGTIYFTDIPVRKII